MIFSNIVTLLRLDLNHQERKAVLMAALGCVLEFYDFIIFGFMATYFINDIFKNSLSTHISILLLFSSILIGYLFRPFGMKLYAKIAPIKELYIVDGIITFFIIIASCLIALIPSHHYTYAIIMLIIARIFHGLASGAEMQSNIDHLMIKIPTKLNVSILGIIAGNEAGILLGIIVNRVFNLVLHKPQMIEYGWRITFFIGAVLSIIVYLIRIKYSEPVSEKYCYRQITPLYKLITLYPKQMFVSSVFAGLRGSTTFLFLFLIPFTLYNTLKYNAVEISHIMLISILASSTVSYLLNTLLLTNRKINYHFIPRLMLFFTIISIPVIFLLGYALANNQYIFVSVILGYILTGVFRLIVPLLVIGLFPSNILLHGFNFSNHSGFVIFAVSLILFNVSVADLLHKIFPYLTYNWAYYIALTFYLIVMSSLTIICLLRIHKYTDLDEVHNLRDRFLKSAARR